jgi:transposase
LQNQRKRNAYYWKKITTLETEEERKQRLLKRKTRYKNNQQITKINKLLQDFFNNYQSTSNNQNKESDSQTQSPQFPSDHKKSGFCYCAVCNKPSSSRPI